VGRLRQRADRIKREVSIASVLAQYGYRVRVDAAHRQQQFPCNLHGDGRDNKPSARVYPASNSWYCFACDKTRDPIETVREVEGIGFREALDWLEKHYSLPSLPFEDEEPEGVAPAGRPAPEPELEVSFEETEKALAQTLNMLTQDRVLPMDTLLPFWEGHDQLAHMREKKALSEAKAQGAMAELQRRVNQLLDGEPGE